MERTVERGRWKLFGALAPLGAFSTLADLVLSRQPAGVMQFGLHAAFVGYVWWRGSRSGVVFIGSMLVVMGAIMTITSLGGDGYTVLYRSFLVLVSISWLASGVFMMTSLDIRAYLAYRTGNPLAAEDDERWGASRGVQIVGRTCGTCGKRFAAERDAVVCSRCTIPFHEGACIEAHRDKTHREVALSDT